jgi:hypothetical protein
MTYAADVSRDISPMTSEEIKKTKVTDLSANAWLREVCLQLALSNEKQPRPVGRPKLENK